MIKAMTMVTMMMAIILTMMIMTTLTNLASTLAFSAMASGLGVFFPILCRAKESFLFYNQ